jgi:glycosyltransferase involved in cell wall biosynthesis
LPTQHQYGGPVDGAISVVFPAHNEEPFLDAAVRDVVDGLRARGRVFEVIVVENGSADKTAGVADRLAIDHTEVRVLQWPSPDYGKSLRTGFLAATGDIVVNFDVDYYDLGFLDRALDRLAGPDHPVVVVGTKRGDGAVDNRPWPRKVVTSGFGTILKLGFGLRVSDTHGMKALRRAPLVELAERCHFGTDLFDTELILRAERAGLATAEIGVTVDETRPSRSPIVGRALRSMLGLGKLRVVLWREARHRR